MIAPTTIDGAMMTDDTIDAVSKALLRAWQLGQTYWQQADSESWKQQDKADGTQKKFEALVDETRALLSASKPAEKVDYVLKTQAELIVSRLRLNSPSIYQDAADIIDRLLAATPTTPAQPCGDAEQADEAISDTGNAEADRIVNRLSSSDPDFDDCIDAVVFIRKLVAEHKGPDGFATWKDAAISERMRRVESEAEFKNFHGLLCERFGYTHDEKDWKRDQLSLIEWIAARAASTQSTATQPAQSPDGRVIDKAMVKRLAVQHGLLLAQPSPTEDIRKLIECAADCISEAVTWEQSGFDTPPMPATEWDYNADQLAYALRALLTAAQPPSGTPND